MRQILIEEKHSFVREAVIATVGLQARQDFNQVEALLPELAKELTQTERTQLIKVMTKEVYLLQRRDLKNGEKQINIDGYRYWVWLDSMRPLTDIEQKMVEWVQKMHQPTAQQMGVQASVAFVKEFDKKEKEEIDKILKEAKKDESITKKKRRRKFRFNMNWFAPVLFLYSLAAQLTTRGVTQYRPIILRLLPEIVVQRRADKSAMKFVLDKWSRLSEVSIKTIAKRLKLTFAVTRYLTILCGLLIIVIVLSIILMLRS